MLPFSHCKSIVGATPTTMTEGEDNMKILCLLKGMLESLMSFQIISGHDFVEIYDNKDVQILKCDKCNEISVGFKGER